MVVDRGRTVVVVVGGTTVVVVVVVVVVVAVVVVDVSVEVELGSEVLVTVDVSGGTVVDVSPIVVDVVPSGIVEVTSGMLVVEGSIVVEEASTIVVIVVESAIVVVVVNAETEVGLEVAVDPGGTVGPVSGGVSETTVNEPGYPFAAQSVAVRWPTLPAMSVGQASVIVHTPGSACAATVAVSE